MDFELNAFMTPTFNLVKPKIKKRYAETLNLSSNELHHPLLKELSQEFYVQSLENITRCYPNYAPTRDEIAQSFRINAEQILLTPGSDFTINLLLTHLGRHKSIILCNPEYYSYSDYALINGLNILKMNVHGERLDSMLEQYLQLLASTPQSIVVLSNPNGITGYSLSIEDIQKIADCCLRQHHLFLIDEAYADFYGLNHLSLLNEYKNIIIVKTFSKSHGIAGLRFSCVFANADLITYLRKTGVENAVSGISIAYFNFLLKKQNIITKIIEDVNRIKQHLIVFLSSQFPKWRIYNTFTHFLTADTHSQEIAETITQYFDNQKITIKHLGTISELQTCIRFTIPEESNLDMLKNIFIQFKDVHLNA